MPLIFTSGYFCPGRGLKSNKLAKSLHDMQLNETNWINSYRSRAMFRFKKKDEQKEDLDFNSGELDLNVLEKEIVELVDIVEEAESEGSRSSEELSESMVLDSPLDDIEFPTEVRQIAEDLGDEFCESGDADEPTSLNLGKELEKATRKRPYGDKVIAETLGLGEDDSLVAALRSEEITGAKDGDEKIDKLSARETEDPLSDDRTLLVNVPDGIGDLGSDLDNEDEEGLLTLTEELNDDKNTTVDTAALKNCPLIEDSLEVKLREKTLIKDESPVNDKTSVEPEVQETKVDLNISEILSTDSLETDLKEELKEDFMNDSGENAYEVTQVEMPSPDLFELEEEAEETVAPDKGEPEIVAGAVAGFASELDDELPLEDEKETGVVQVKESGSVDQEAVVEEVVKKIQPEILEMVAKSVKEQLPEIIEKIVRDEVAKIKKILSES